jgi:hypothetical protein
MGAWPCQRYAAACVVGFGSVRRADPCSARISTELSPTRTPCADGRGYGRCTALRERRRNEPNLDASLINKTCYDPSIGHASGTPTSLIPCCARLAPAVDETNPISTQDSWRERVMAQEFVRALVGPWVPSQVLLETTGDSRFAPFPAYRLAKRTQILGALEPLGLESRPAIRGGDPAGGTAVGSIRPMRDCGSGARREPSFGRPERQAGAVNGRIGVRLAFASAAGPGQGARSSFRSSGQSMLGGRRAARSWRGV